MIEKKLTKKDQAAIKNTARHLISIHGKEAVQSSMKTFGGHNELTGIYTDDGYLVGWVVRNIIDEVVSAIADERAIEANKAGLPTPPETIASLERKSSKNEELPSEPASDDSRGKPEQSEEPSYEESSGGVPEAIQDSAKALAEEHGRTASYDGGDGGADFGIAAVQDDVDMFFETTSDSSDSNLVGQSDGDDAESETAFDSDDDVLRPTEETVVSDADLFGDIEEDDSESSSGFYDDAGTKDVFDFLKDDFGLDSDGGLGGALDHDASGALDLELNDRSSQESSDSEATAAPVPDRVKNDGGAIVDAECLVADGDYDFDGMLENSSLGSKKTKKNPVAMFLKILVVIVVVFAIAIAAYAAISGSLGSKTGADVDRSDESNSGEDFSSYRQMDEKDIVHIKVASGSSIDDIVEKMLSAGCVSQGAEFAEAVEAIDASSSIQSGDYIVAGDESASDIVLRMVLGDKVPDGVVGVNEGSNVPAIADAIVAANVPVTAGDFIQSSSEVDMWRHEFSMLEGVPANLPSLEGYFDSGEFNLRFVRTTEDVIRTLLAPAQERFEQYGMSSHDWLDVLTKASLIQKEALFDEDMYKISSVIDNRLEAGMKLQIDASVKYANSSDEPRVMESDLLVESPYNTYFVDGLPVGPICSGIMDKDIQAAINPEKTDYLYYVLGDTVGHHVFCETAEEFENAKQEYLVLFGYDDDDSDVDSPNITD